MLRGIGHMQRVVFKILGMMMWTAPIGVFGAMSAVVGFYITCALFIIVILGTILRVFTGFSILKLLK